MKIREAGHFPIFLLGILSGTIVCVGLIIFFPAAANMSGNDRNMEYTDLVVIMLASVTVVVTVLAVFIGILAIWGYSQFEKLTRRASEHHVEKILFDSPLVDRIDHMVVDHVATQLETGELRNLLISRIDRIILSDARKRAESEDDSDTGDGTPEIPYED